MGSSFAANLVVHSGLDFGLCVILSRPNGTVKRGKS